MRDVAGTSYLYRVQVSEIACRENFSQSLRGLGGPRAWVFQGLQRWKMTTKSREESGKAIEMLRNLSRETISSNITEYMENGLVVSIFRGRILSGGTIFRLCRLMIQVLYSYGGQKYHMAS